MMVKWGWMIWKRDNNRETKDQSNSQIDKQKHNTSCMRPNGHHKARKLLSRKRRSERIIKRNKYPNQPKKTRNLTIKAMPSRVRERNAKTSRTKRNQQQKQHRHVY